MPQLKLHVKKVGSKNPQTKQSGFVVRVQNNGTAAMVTPRTTVVIDPPSPVASGNSLPFVEPKPHSVASLKAPVAL